MDAATAEQPPRISGTLSSKQSEDSSEPPKKGEEEMDIVGKAEESLLADGAWTAEGGSRDPSGAGLPSKKSVFSEIAQVREEILKQPMHDPSISDDALGNRVPPDILGKLGSVRDDRKAARIQEIMSDPTRNSEQILEALKAMKNESSSVPESAPNPNPNNKEGVNEDVAVLADALSPVDAVPSKKSERHREGSAEKEKPKKVTFTEIKEYLSELSLAHFLKGMRKGRFDKGGVPHLSLDTLAWKDGRPLLEVVAPMDRSATAKLLKDMEAELAGLNESELARRTDIFNDISLSFLKVQDSIRELEKTDTLDALEAISFPVPMKKMKELGLNELSEQHRKVLAGKQGHALKIWGAAKDAVRKRLSGAEEDRKSDSEMNLDSSAADVVPTAESPERATETPDFESVKRTVEEAAEAHIVSILEKVREAADSDDRKTLSLLRGRGWRVFDLKRFPLPDGLSEDEKRRLTERLSEMNAASKERVQSAIEEVYLSMAKEAPHLRKFHYAVEGLAGLGPINGRAAGGQMWSKKFREIEKAVLAMDDDEFALGEWRESVPEPLREKFAELVAARRAEDRAVPEPEAVPVAEPAADADLAEETIPVGAKLSEGNPPEHAPAEEAAEAGGHAEEGASVSEEVKAAYDGSLAAAGRYNDGVRKSVENTPEIIHSRRGTDHTASVESVEKDRKIAELRERILSLKTEVSEKESYRAGLEIKRRKQREETTRLTNLRSGYEKRFSNFFLRRFSDKNLLGRFGEEEESAKQKLEDLDAEWVQKNDELKYLHAELSEAIHDLEELSGEQGLTDSFDRESVAKAYGIPPGNITVVGDGEMDGAGVKGKNGFVEKVDGVVAAGKSGLESAPGQPGKEGMIYPSAAEWFTGEFGIELIDLKEAGLGQLSEGRQLLVLENLRQLTIGRIQEEAIDRAGRDAKEGDKWVRGTNWIRKGWKSASRKYQIAKMEKATEAEIMRGGMAVHGEILRQLVEGALSGPEAEVDSDTGELQIHFAGGKQFADIPESERGILDAFNVAADAFSKIPAEWQYEDSAKKKDHKKYEEGERGYIKARNELLRFLNGRYGEEEAMWTIGDLDAKVRMTQFFQTTKDAEEQFRSIKDDAAWTRMWRDSITEHGIAFGLGVGARTAAAASAGFLAAPLLPTALAAAGLVGGIRAYIRSKEQLKEKERRSRKGRGEASDPTKEKFPSPELSSELTRLSDASLDAFGEKDQEEKLILLRKSLDVIRKKLKNGMVDFGKEDTASGNEYALLSALSRAGAVVAMYSAEESSEFETRFNEAVASNDRFIDGETARAKKKQALFVGKNIATGAIISVTSAGLGYGARYAAEHGSSILGAVSDRLAVPDGAKETLDGALGASPKQTPAGEPSAWLKAGTKAAPAPEAPIPETPRPDIPVMQDKWGGAGNGNIRNASYEQPEAAVPPKPAFVPPESTGQGPVGPKTSGVGMNGLRDRISLVGETGPGLSPEGQAAVLNSDQPMADQAPLNEATVNEIARQEALELEALNAEDVAGQTGDGAVSKAVSDEWNESVGGARLGQEVPSEMSLASNEPEIVSGSGAATDTMGGIPETTGGNDAAVPDAGSVADKAESAAIVDYKTEQVKSAGEVAREYAQGKTGVQEEIVAETPPTREAVRPDWKTFIDGRELVKSDEVREYLATHPENVESYRKSLADYDTSIFEMARGETGMRGVANIADLNDAVKAKQVMYDCLKLIRDPLTPTYEVKTYQLANSLNFDQMRNVGEFMMKASERFGKGAFPIGDESLRGYVERMTALFVEHGETIKLNGDTRLLKQLAFQGFKR